MATKKSKKKSKKKSAAGRGKKKKVAKRKQPVAKKSAKSKKKSTSKKKAASKKKSTSKKKARSKKQDAAKKKKPASRKKNKTKARNRRGRTPATLRDAGKPARSSSSVLFRRLKKELKTIKVAGEKLWIAEGDTLLNENELKLYARQREKADEAHQAALAADLGGLGTRTLGLDASRGMVANTSDGKITQWPRGSTLTYRVVRSTFDRSSRYDTTVKNMKLAAADWELTCGIRFEHKSQLDDKPGTGPAGAKFAVRMDTSGGGWIALSFFPNAPAERRLLLISPSYFRRIAYDKVGMLRHEIGHILGFRHEHIRSGAPPECPQDSGTFTSTELTRYDPQSVMHYFCGGVGSKKLEISDLDKFSAQQVYGPPIGDSDND